jgi:hypothetical protein
MAIPWVASFDERFEPLNLLLMPGMLIALPATGGYIHDLNWGLVLIGNVIIYSAGMYLFIGVRRRLKARTRSDKSNI